MVLTELEQTDFQWLVFKNDGMKIPDVNFTNGGLCTGVHILLAASDFVLLYLRRSANTKIISMICRW